MFYKLWKKNVVSNFLEKRRKTLEIYHRINNLTEQELREKIFFFKKIFLSSPKKEWGKILDKILPSVFAIVKKVIENKIGLSLFPTQILGAIALHNGKIIQMNTGEGKTITAFLPICLNALTGRTVFVITSNDYLAERDQKLVEPILDFFDISSGFNSNKLDNEQLKNLYEEKKVIYSTANKICFDFLKNSLVKKKSEQFKSDYFYIIIDEADSILLDESQNPLLITLPPSGRFTNQKEEIDEIITNQKITESTVLASLLKEKEDYSVDNKKKALWLKKRGVRKSEIFFGLEKDSFFSFENNYNNFLIRNALYAKHFYIRNVDYVVRENRVIIINQLTGRLVPQQVYAGGIQEAVESKERIFINRSREPDTKITLQVFFRLFEKMSGMTGTAIEDEEEFKDIYGLEVIVIPPYRRMIRKDHPDLFFLNKQIKYKKIIEKIKEINQSTRQPILVGTSNVEVSEVISSMLRKEGIFHWKLNAINHAQEAEIISHGGEVGSIIISTNMAGRGTDIILSSESKKKGGLLVIGVEDEFTLRTRRQLIGRSGRQGDPGESQFFVSLEDEILKNSKSDFEFAFSLLDEKDEGVSKNNFVNNWLSNIVSEIQESIKLVEKEVRKENFIFDLLVDKQRRKIYEIRQKILESNNMSDLLKNLEIKNVKPEIDFQEIFFFSLEIIDEFWKEYLFILQKNRRLSGLEVYIGKDPKEAFFLRTIKIFDQEYNVLMSKIKEKIFSSKNFITLE